MKQFFRIFLVAAFAFVGITSASAQTKEFLESFNQVKHMVELHSTAKGIELVQYPAEMLRAMGVKFGGQNILGNLKVIYQVKIPMDNENRSYGFAAYNRFTRLVHLNQKPKLYEQIMCQTTKEREISIYKAIRKKSGQPNEFMILIRSKEKAIVCDIVGYLDVNSIIKMLSPELRNHTAIDSLSISNK